MNVEEGEWMKVEKRGRGWRKERKQVRRRCKEENSKRRRHKGKGKIGEMKALYVNDRREKKWIDCTNRKGRRYGTGR